MEKRKFIMGDKFCYLVDGQMKYGLIVQDEKALLFHDYVEIGSRSIEKTEIPDEIALIEKGTEDTIPCDINFAMEAADLAASKCYFGRVNFL